MDVPEAQGVLNRELLRFAARSWADLALVVDGSTWFDVRGASGVLYQVQIQVFWDNQPGGVLRVMGCVDDGGWRAFSPLTDDFLVPRPSEDSGDRAGRASW